MLPEIVELVQHYFGENAHHPGLHEAGQDLGDAAEADDLDELSAVRDGSRH